MYVEDATKTQLGVDSYLRLLAECREEFGNESQPYKSVTGNWKAC